MRRHSITNPLTEEEQRAGLRASIRERDRTARATEARQVID
jgi:hypothetical protein